MRIFILFCISILTSLTGIASVQAQTINQLNSNEFSVPAAKLKGTETSIYLVQMKGDPVIAYEGEISGYRATKPGKGKKINKNSANVKKYAKFLETQQDQTIQSAGGSKVYNYRYAFNGFAARMTASEAATLETNANVMHVWKDEILQLQTDTSPNYVGITEGGQAWSKGWVGEDVVIASIDTGLWPEHPSFADVPTPKKGNKGPNIAYGPAPNFTSSGCDFGNTAANPADTPASCSNKLVTARCYNLGFSSGPDAANPCGGDGASTGSHEFQSARDVDGHGSHTAATAGGNYGVVASIGGNPAGSVSGIAPRARIAGYKVCWDGPDQTVTTDDGCASSDSAAAIDQAVADGADVINFSVGGASTSFSGPDDIAFLFAADAGVLVATSNGNSGPAAETTGTPAGVPWITSVGASQDDGVFYSALTVTAPAGVAGDYVAVEGTGPIFLADTGALSGDIVLVDDGTGVSNDGCEALTNGAAVNGNIALVVRGACNFSTKYDTAAAAGATAIVVYNDGADASRVDPFSMSSPGTTIPGFMVSSTDGSAIAAASGVTGTLDPANSVPAESRIAGFSSRGPNGGEPDIIKPDLAAPGVGILAAGSPAQTGELFQSINGTSMASPHVAGSFALLRQAHPDWSAAQAKSALMTTARQDLKKTFGDDDADPFDIGSGEIRPSDAFDPGLTYDASILDYVRYTCGSATQNQIFGAATCAAFGSIDASDLNMASIGVADLIGSQTVTRTVTSVANNNGNKTFNVSVDAPVGIDVVVSPSSITLKAGESADYSVTFTVTGAAALDQWTFGSLTWADNGSNYSVRSTVAVRPTAFSTVSEVDGSADGAGVGSVDVPVEFGYDGIYSADVAGLAASFSTGPVNLTGPQGNLTFFCVDLPAMSHFRLAMFDEDTSDPGSDDLDLRLFLATDCATFDIAQVGSSGGVTSNEVIDLSNAPAGGYVGVVDFFSASNGTDTNFNLWFQPVFGDAGNTSVTAPASAVLGSSGTVTVDYSGVVPTRNLGVLIHSDGVGEIDRTVLDIDAR